MDTNGKTNFILHMCTTADWETAKVKGEYKAASFDDIGFIHCSTPQQLLKVANTLYQKAPDLLVLWIDPAKLIAPLKWEDADGDSFPHIYGAIILSAVVAVYDYLPDSDGVFRAIPGMAEHGIS